LPKYKAANNLQIEPYFPKYVALLSEGEKKNKRI
jgi:hypothetical protein